MKVATAPSREVPELAITDAMSMGASVTHTRTGGSSPPPATGGMNAMVSPLRTAVSHSQWPEDQDGDVIHRSAADVRHLDALTLGDPEPAQLGITIVAAPPAVGDDATQGVVVRARPQWLAQIDACGGEQAGVELSVDTETRARAVTAEGTAHRRDHPEVTLAVCESIGPRHGCRIG